MFIGLNPSTANETEDDATIRRVIGFAKKWGYGAVYMANLFPFISTDPKKLEDCMFIGENDVIIKVAASFCSEVIFAWGSFDQAKPRVEAMQRYFQKAKALIINKDGSPRHPLYCPYTLSPMIYNQSS